MSVSKSRCPEDESGEEFNTQNFISVCGICLSAFKVPKGLPCMHTFCLACIREWASIDRSVGAGAISESQVVSCPNCRKDCVLPASGVDGLPTNFFITKRDEVDNPPVCNSCEIRDREIVARCRECGFVCDECTRSHKSMRSLKKHPVILLDTLRVGKTEIRLATLGLGADEARIYPGSGTFNLEKTIYLKGVDASYNAWSCAITSSSMFEVAVPSRANGKVYVFGIEGKVKLAIDAKKGLIPGRSSIPFSVTTTSSGHYYITDCNPWVTIHDKCGHFLRQFQLQLNGSTVFRSGDAKGIIIDSKERVVVGDVNHKFISVYKGGKFINGFTIDVQPVYIAAKSGEVELLIVTDGGTETILEVDYSGNVNKKIKPPLADVKWNPMGVCCSKFGEIFVANGVVDRGCVCRFTNTWEYTGCVISDLKAPRGVAISGDGELFAVVDAGTQLKIFRRGQ